MHTFIYSLLLCSLAIDFSNIDEKDQEMTSSKLAIAKNEAANEPYEFTYEGRQFVVFPHVYSPTVFPSTFYIIDNMAITPGQSFLELGSGTGLLAIAAALKGANPVFATDISPIAVANTQENARRYDLVIDVREGSVFDPIGADEKFDVILWNAPYMHVNKTDLTPIEAALYDPFYRGLTQFFAEGKKHLNPGGKLWFGASNTHMHMDVLQQLLDTYGWTMRIIAEKTVPLPPTQGGASWLNVQFCEALPQ